MKNQKGFTLIEIVMVLVLIGVLGAIAAPKYFDLRAEALARSAQATVAELQSRINATFAQNLLQGESCTTAQSRAQAVALTGSDWSITAGTAAGDEGNVVTAITYKGETVNTSLLEVAPKLYYPACGSARTAAGTN